LVSRYGKVRNMKNRIGVTSNEITLIAFMFTSFCFSLTVNDSASNIFMHLHNKKNARLACY